MERSVNPAMITLAREAQGKTQTELARQLSVPQSKVSKMESGLIGVSADMLAALSQTLRFPEKFFFQTFEVYPAGIHLYLFRKHKTLQSKELSRIVAWMNLKAPSFNSCFDYLQMGSLTGYLKQLIAESAMPLQSIETDFAVDSFGVFNYQFCEMVFCEVWWH